VNRDQAPDQFVTWFRHTAPYINAFRGRTFVVAFGGEMLAEPEFPGLIHDLALLNSLGVRLLLVHGARPQIAQRLTERGAELHYVNGLRITDDAALACVREAAGAVRVEIEARLSLGLPNSPMAGAAIRVTSGNFVTARPLGVRNGIDYLHTGEVRRIDSSAIERLLGDGSMVLLPPLGYSPTGEVFNLSALDVATEAAVALRADKLICLADGALLTELPRELTTLQLDQLLQQPLAEPLLRLLTALRRSCGEVVRRCHLLDRQLPGSLLRELFTRDGVGTLISDDRYEAMRTATIDDVGGILALIEPLERDGVLVRRSRERLEMEIDHFTVVERDGTIIGCAALYPIDDEPVAELACLAVHRHYRDQGRGDDLLGYIERQARQQQRQQLFVLTTHTAHWFLERGFTAAPLQALPVARQQLYNYQRRSQVFIKPL